VGKQECRHKKEPSLLEQAAYGKKALAGKQEVSLFSFYENKNRPHFHFMQKRRTKSLRDGF